VTRCPEIKNKLINIEFDVSKKYRARDRKDLYLFLVGELGVVMLISMESELCTKCPNADFNHLFVNGTSKCI
jgi:hypothetical protein